MTMYQCLQEGDPPMPNTTGTLPSGSSLRVKKSFLNKPLTEEAAKDLGISKYFHRFVFFFHEVTPIYHNSSQIIYQCKQCTRYSNVVFSACAKHWTTYFTISTYKLDDH